MNFTPLNHVFVSLCVFLEHIFGFRVNLNFHPIFIELRITYRYFYHIFSQNDKHIFDQYFHVFLYFQNHNCFIFGNKSVLCDLVISLYYLYIWQQVAIMRDVIFISVDILKIRVGPVAVSFP